MIKIQDAEQLHHRQLRDGADRRIGRIRAIACPPDDRYAVEWALVDLAPFRTRPRLVPLHAAHLRADGSIYVPYPRTMIAAMPAAHENDLTDAYTHTLTAARYAQARDQAVEPTAPRRAD